MGQRPLSKSAPWMALGLALLLGFWHGASARPGHAWSGLDDFTAYLLHGRNLVEGREYAAIDSVVDAGLPPANLREAFPPAYPLLLALAEAPVVDDADPRRYALGLDLLRFKRVNATLLALALFLAYLLFRPTLGDRLALLQIFVLGTLPFLFNFREFVRSEWAFVVVVLAQFLVLARFDRCDSDDARRWLYATVAGLLGVLAYATRTAGMVLPLALLTHELWRWRRPRAPILLALALMGAGLLTVRAVFPEVTSGYAAHAGTRLGMATVVENLQHYWWELQRIFGRSVPGPLPLLVPAGLVGLALLGALSRLRAPSRAEIFLGGSLAMHLILPTDSAWLRYLIPLLPFVFFLVFVGALFLGRRFVVLRGLPLATGALVFAVSLPGLFSLPGGLTGAAPLDDGPTTDATLEAFDWVRERALPDDVVVFRKPWSLNLANGARTHVYPQAHLYPELTLAEHLAHLDRTQARWLLLRTRERRVSGPYNTLDYDDLWYRDTVITPAEEQFVQRAANAEFVLLERLDATR